MLGHHLFKLAKNIYKEDALKETEEIYSEYLIITSLTPDNDNLILSIQIKEIYLSREYELIGHFLNYLLQNSIELIIKSGGYERK